MNSRLCVNGRFFRLLSGARLIPVLIGIFFLPISGTAKPRPSAQSDCKLAFSTDSRDSPVVVSMKELEKDPQNYYGKMVTVDGELHRTFTDNVFTIEDDGFFRDKDVLVISTVPKSEAVVPLEHSLKPGKNVRVTGVVQPYDRGKLECAYGPLHLESREGHSFTKNPVLIVDKRQPVKETIPILLEKPAPTVSMPPAPEPEPAPPAAPAESTQAAATPEPEETPAALPKTASQVPLLAIAGLCALCAALLSTRIRN